MLAVALVTFREAIRKKIVLLAGILTLGFIGLYGTGLYYIGIQMDVMPDAAMRAAVNDQFLIMGLFLASFIVSVTAIFASVGAISSEVESGLMHAVLARPIRRSEVVVGKFLGYALMITAYSAVIFLSITWLAKVFVGTSTRSEPLALILFCLQPVILMAVAVAFSSFLSTLGSGIAAFTLYAVAFVGGFIEQIGAFIRSETLVKWGIFSSLVNPSDALYRMAVKAVIPPVDIVTELSRAGPFGAISEPSGWMLVYALVYLVGTLLLAIRIFSRRDV